MSRRKYSALSFRGILDVLTIGLVLIAIALWKRLNRRAILLVLLAVINYAFVLPLYFGKPPAAQEKPIRAMLMNIHAVNGNTGLVLNAIRDADPDILVQTGDRNGSEKQHAGLRFSAHLADGDAVHENSDRPRAA